MSKARETLARYVGYAEDTTENGLSSDSPLAIEHNGKYIDVLFQTGGPHFDIQFRFEDAEATDYWFENEPVWAVAHFADWGESDYCDVYPEDAATILAAITRDSSELESGE